MTEYVPLYVNGKRDKARRYVNISTGEIISRRQYIKITEGASPESKELILVPTTPELIKEKWGWKEVPKKLRGYYQVLGRYRFRNEKTGEVTTVNGYSTVTKRKCRGKELQRLCEQAFDYAISQLDGWRWVLDDIEHQVLVKW